MIVDINNLKTLLEKNLNTINVDIQDSRGDGSHLEITIISDDFLGKSDIQKHQMVYSILGDCVGKEIHAVALNLQTSTKEESSYEDSKTKSLKSVPEDSILHKIHEAINKFDIILFMKGSKDMPMCGFSSTVNHILQSLNVEYMDVNVLSSIEIRDGIKQYSNWPTIPQLYVKGSFIGGCDIVSSMYENGSLQELLKKYDLIK